MNTERFSDPLGLLNAAGGKVYLLLDAVSGRRTTGLSEQPVKTNFFNLVNWVESELARRPSPKHFDLLPQDQNLGLKRSSRPEKIREHPPDQSAQVQYHATASPDSQSTTSRIWFAVGTGLLRCHAAMLVEFDRRVRQRGTLASMRCASDRSTELIEIISIAERRGGAPGTMIMVAIRRKHGKERPSIISSSR